MHAVAVPYRGAADRLAEQGGQTVASSDKNYKTV
jgi:hypothetical protein